MMMLLSPDSRLALSSSLSFFAFPLSGGDKSGDINTFDQLSVGLKVFAAARITLLLPVYDTLLTWRGPRWEIYRTLILLIYYCITIMGTVIWFILHILFINTILSFCTALLPSIAIRIRTQEMRHLYGDLAGVNRIVNKPYIVFKFLDQVIGKTNFGPNTAVVIVKFKMAAHAQCYYYCCYWVYWPRKHGKDTKIKSMNFLYRYMGKTNFGPNDR